MIARIENRIRSATYLDNSHFKEQEEPPVRESNQNDKSLKAKKLKPHNKLEPPFSMN